MKRKAFLFIFLLLVVLVVGYVSYRNYAVNNDLETPERIIAGIFGGGGAKPNQAVLKGSASINYEIKGFTASYDGMLIKCDSESVKAYDGKGDEKWSVAFKSVGNIYAKASGPYLLVADIGGSRLMVLDGGNVRMETDFAFNINNADISHDGKIAVVHNDPNNRNAVSVYNLKQNELFTRYIVDSQIADARFTASNNTLLIYSIDASGGVLDSGFEYADMSGEIKGQQVHKSDSIFSGLETPESDTAVILNDTTVFSINSKKGQIWENDFGKNNVLCYSAAKDKSLIVAVRNDWNSGIGNNSTLIKTLNLSGKITGEFSLSDEISQMTCSGNYIALVAGNRVLVYNRKGISIATLKVKSDVQKVCFLGYNKIAVVMNDSIDFYEI